MQRATTLRAAHRVPCILALCCAVASMPSLLRAQVPAAPPPAAVQRGFVVGQAIDKASGRPMPAVNIFIVGTALRTQTDLDGRYRLPIVPGIYSVRAQRLGNVAVQVDGVRVVAGASVTANFALTNAVVQLQAVAVTAAPTKANSEDALLAMQRASSRVSDGISAEAIKRAPGSNAGDAIVRVTGVSIVDNKFAVVRGLAERYSNTLLNGVELPSPEPTKKIVPLDLFPSSLLESIVVSKTATPDKPGDFTGGSVEVSTKEFPNDRVVDVNVQSGFNSQSTFRSISHFRQSGVDLLGFDQGGRHQMPTPIPTGSEPNAAVVAEAFAERLRNAWTPRPTPVAPDFGVAFNTGGRLGGDNAPFGYVISATHNRRTAVGENRLLQIIFDGVNGVPERSRISSDAQTQVDIGGIANFTLRIGSGQKIGWKNLYTRGNEEFVSRAVQINPEGGTNTDRNIFQARYVTRSLYQTQLTGEHLLDWLFGSRFEWKATRARATRDEPENRSLTYISTPGNEPFVGVSVPNFFFFRFLKDDVLSGQADWATPLPSILPSGSQLKLGTLARNRQRAFTGFIFRTAGPGLDGASALLKLPPEQVFAPEVIGGDLILRRESSFRLPYEADDNIRAYYAMMDLPLRPWLRLVAGLRREDWALDLYPISRADTTQTVNRRRNNDYLPSGNLTINLTSRQNLRAAAYETVARPDPREISDDYYEPVAGDCAQRGNPFLTRARVRNADLRWERYPRAGEIMSLSGFVKAFTDPIAELLANETGNCSATPVNLETARVVGGELELRRGLRFLPGALGRVVASVNVTVVRSEATLRIDTLATVTYPLAGQSDILGNANLRYASDDGAQEISGLLNYFSDRVVRYGASSLGANGINTTPNVIEQGRFSVDMKVRRRFGRANVSLSARNLLDAEVIFTQRSTEGGNARTGYFRPGIAVTLGVGYALR